MLRTGIARARCGVAALALAALVSAGCFHTLGGTSREPSVEALGKLHQGVTTPADVERLFGPPTQTLRPAPDKQLLRYDYGAKEDPQHPVRYQFEFTDGVLARFTIERIE